MDDLLLCAKNSEDLDCVLKETIKAVEEAGFETQQDKIQMTSPWNYLGLHLREQNIVLQQLVIRDHPKTLHHLQQLCSFINWVHPLLGITTEDLAPLFNLLQRGEEPSSPRALIPEARIATLRVPETLSSQQAPRYEPSLPFFFTILGKGLYFYGLIFQWDADLKGLLLILDGSSFTVNQPKPYPLLKS